jgi:maltooligosyltrehalose trehalohydrolase
MIRGAIMIESKAACQPRRAGALRGANGSVLWRVWAPRAKQVTLVLRDDNATREFAMGPEPRGYHRRAIEDVADGQRYAYRLDGGPERADPCSLWQPEGLFGPSAVVSPERFSWTNNPWRGAPRKELVFYEIHVGTFTPEGTFEAIIPRLADLKELGITAIEIMPVGQFSGARNWGYDGVLPYATQNTYGGPTGFQSLIDACHRHGMAIFLDVVFNHFGPEGNHLSEFGPYVTDRYQTPWGEAVNYDRGGCDAVRDFVLDNVGMWLEEFQIDGLRIDAADVIFDLGARHILRSIKERADRAASRRGWPAIVMAESDLDDPRLLDPKERGGFALDAQWMDDYQHAFHAFLTGERQDYYADFGEPDQLARILEEPYLHHWEYSAFRDRTYGAKAEGLARDRFVVFLQNHDQVGNRARSDRLGVVLGSPAKQRLAASILLLSPYLPLLFMGEEYGEESPFPFFCSYRSRELAQAVLDGRRSQFAHWTGGSEVPDPGSERTFASARLSWSWPEGSFRAGLRRLYRDLLGARRQWSGLLDSEDRKATVSRTAAGALRLDLSYGNLASGGIRAFFNLDSCPQALPDWRPGALRTLFSSEAEQYSGSRAEWSRITDLMPFECVVVGPAEHEAFATRA